MMELNERYNQLKSDPEYNSYLSVRDKNKLRDVKLKSFPYLIIYQITGDEVVIYAIHNSHKRPKKYK